METLKKNCFINTNECVFNKIALTLLVLALGLSQVLYKSVDSLYLIIFIWGGILFFSARKNVLPSPIKIFYFWSILLLISISISIVNSDISYFFKWRFSTYQWLLFIPFIYLFLNTYIKNVEVFWKLLIISSMTVVFWLFWVLYNLPITRDTGLLSDAINRGNMAMLAGLVSLVSFFALPSIRWKYISVIVFFSGIMLSLLTGSRGGWFALILAFSTLFLILYKYKRKTDLKVLGFLIFTIFISIILLLPFLPVLDRIKLIFDNLSLYSEGHIATSVGVRLELYKMSIHAFLEKPLLGWGWGSFKDVQQLYMNEGFIRKIPLFGHPHNQFLLFAVEAGILGITSLMAFLFWPVIFAIKWIKSHRKFEPRVYLTVLLLIITESIVEFSMTDQTFSYKYFVLYFTFISVYSISYLHGKTR